eukprot:jgi/Chlat1/2858/Chrsp194S00794
MAYSRYTRGQFVGQAAAGAAGVGVLMLTLWNSSSAGATEKGSAVSSKEQAPMSSNEDVVKALQAERTSADYWREGGGDYDDDVSRHRSSSTR